MQQLSPENLFNVENNDMNKIMIAPKLAKLLIWKIRQGIAVLSSLRINVNGVRRQDKPMPPLMTMALN